MMKRGFLLIVLVILPGMGFSCANTMNSTPQALGTLADVRIVPPAYDLPPEFGALSGKWGGQWYDRENQMVLGVNAVLVVEEILDTKHAKIVYSWNNNIGQHYSNKGQADLSMDEQGVSLSFSSPVRSARFKFRIINGVLEGISGPYGTLLRTYAVKMMRIE